MTPQAIADLLDLQLSVVWQWVIVFFRVGPIMALVPGFSEQSVPIRVRLGLTLAMTTIAAPLLPLLAADQVFIFPVLMRLIITETLSGLIIGLGLRMFILALQTAGSMAAQATSLSQIFGGTGVEPLPAFGHILVMGGLALAMMMDLHLHVAQLIIRSYQMLPFGEFAAAPDVTRWGVDRVNQSFSLAFRLAMPFVLISVLYNLTLGVINRAMPQLMVAFVGAPVITAGGLILLMLMSPVMLSVWIDALTLFLNNPWGNTP